MLSLFLRLCSDYFRLRKHQVVSQYNKCMEPGTYTSYVCCEVARCQCDCRPVEDVNGSSLHTWDSSCIIKSTNRCLPQPPTSASPSVYTKSHPSLCLWWSTVTTRVPLLCFLPPKKPDTLLAVWRMSAHVVATELLCQYSHQTNHRVRQLPHET